MQISTLTLPDSLIWADEHTPQAVAQTMRRALDGSPVVYYSTLTAGRSITLKSASDTGWITHAQVEALAALAAVAGAVYTLTIRGASYDVMFAHHEPPALEAVPLWPISNPQAGDFYLATIKLITV